MSHSNSEADFKLLDAALRMKRFARVAVMGLRETQSRAKDVLEQQGINAKGDFGPHGTARCDFMQENTGHPVRSQGRIGS